MLGEKVWGEDEEKQAGKRRSKGKKVNSESKKLLKVKEGGLF